MVDWTELTELTDRSLTELRAADEVYRPTNFWGPGVDQLLDNMTTLGLPKFKSWPSSSIWFYPLYGDRWTEATIKEAFEQVTSGPRPKADRNFFISALNGSQRAQRDYDVASVNWNQQRWPFDLAVHGESTVGTPPQAYSVGQGHDARFGRGYANYLLCLSALSQHVDVPPKSFLEIGGGFGVLGEIVTQRDPEARYVDLDIPPLLTVASYYLTELLGTDNVTVYADEAAAPGPISVPRSGVLPNYRIDDLAGEFEVFVNSFSFQEMEPAVVEHYIQKVCSKGIIYAVSLNSRLGKPKAEKAGDWGALDPVTSARIIEMFDAQGLELVGQYDAPVVRSAGQLNVFRRR